MIDLAGSSTPSLPCPLDFPQPRSQRRYGKGAGFEGLRPSFISPWKCRNVLVEGVTLVESPMWNVHPVYSENIIVRGITVRSLDSWNGDGINPDSCRNVLIEYNHLETGDDAVTVKSGLNCARILLPRLPSGAVIISPEVPSGSVQIGI